MADITIEAENVRLWINEHVRDDRSKWYTYSISTSSKDKDTGEYINKSLEVRMTRNVWIPDDLKNGAIVSITGSLSNRKYTDKEGKERIEHMIWARSMDIDNSNKPRESTGPADSFDALEEDLPF